MRVELLICFPQMLACLKDVGLLYCCAGLDTGASDVGIVSSGDLCHFLLLTHYLTSFAVFGGTFSSCMQQIRENN